MADEVINIYCDESCHMPNDRNPVMTLGSISVPKSQIRAVSQELDKIKEHYKCRGELKWTKVSNKNILFYLALVDFLFNQPSLYFRSLIVCNKEKLDHKQFNKGDHNAFYYKMYYYLVRNIAEINKNNPVHIYLDIKDTQSTNRVNFLAEVLANSLFDFERKRIQRIQEIRSHESQIMQLCDFFLGAITYANRNLSTSSAKLQIIASLERHAGHSLKCSTPPWEPKFNLFHFAPREAT